MINFQKTTARSLARTLGLLGIAILTGLHSAADPLDDAKNAGQIGERWNGYVALVSSAAPSSVKQLVDQTNSKRRTLYLEIARKNELTLGDVERLAAAKAFKRTRAGHFLQAENGGWQKK